jgi:undecaprenyl-diphosphatase
MDPISYFQAIVLGLLQGVSELFPISSLGHSVVLPRVFGWNIHQNDDYFLSFLVATHCATAIVLFFFFLKDWVRILKGLGRSLRDRYIDPDDPYAKLGWLLVAGTIPAGLLGLLLEHPLRSLFASTETAAIFLFVNGLMLFGAEALRRRAPVRSEQGMRSDEVISRTLTFRSALGIGAAQALALIPGLSRSGASMGGGLVAGLLKLPELLGHQGDHVRGQALVGAIAAAVTAYFSVKFLLRFFETNRLTPFAVYCCAVGAILSIAFALS